MTAHEQDIYSAEAGHPHVLVAHVYECYLGDLNGGQVLKRLSQDQLPSAALTFYDFPDISDTRVYARHSRLMFDPIALTDKARNPN